jgi:putative acetyltransferase
MFEVKQVNPAQSEVMSLIQQLDEYQESMYPAESNHLDPIDELSKSNVVFLATYIDSEVCGIGCVKMFDDYGELKRLYVTGKYRGKGLAKALIKELESHLARNRIMVARLETGIHQHEAIGLYKTLGYSETGPFGDYAEDPLSVFMERKLGPT